jgi:hypothetical protein
MHEKKVRLKQKIEQDGEIHKGEIQKGAPFCFQPLVQSFDSLLQWLVSVRTLPKKLKMKTIVG